MVTYTIQERIMHYEAGELSPADSVYLFATIIGNGMVYAMDKDYVIMARRMMRLGIINELGEIDMNSCIENGIEI
jgi:hypothetical protein